MVNSVTVIGLDAPVFVMPPGFEVTVYEMIALSPLETGAAKITIAWAFPAVAVTSVGAPGTVAGTTGVVVLEELDGGPVPTEFLALTVKV